MVVPWLILPGIGGPVARSQPAEPSRPRPAETSRSAWLHEVYLGDVSAYAFALDADGKRPLELRRDPIMRWTGGGDYHGEVYVWTRQGRAAVVGCVYSAPQRPGIRQIVHEFHSLAPQPLVAVRKGGSGWQPQEAGITLEPIPDAPPPAGTRVSRLAQMRELARRFRSEMMNRGDKTELRLLPQPLYRYEIAGEGSAVVDGAVFAFVWTAGTDPEVLLVIEAVGTEGKARWQFAPARFTNREVWVKDQDREVWRADVLRAGNFDGTTWLRYGVFSVKSVTVPGEAK